MRKVILLEEKKDFLYFFTVCVFVLFYSLLIEFNNYKNLTEFDTAIVKAKVLNQYSKKNYFVLKLKSQNGFIFYTSSPKKYQDIRLKDVILQIKTYNISFYKFLKGFYAKSKLLHVDNQKSFKEHINKIIYNIHQNKNVAMIYQALYTAMPLPKTLQDKLSQLGISHLVAISGFHLGVFSAVLFFIFKPVYSFFQSRFFPYRSAKIDLFVFVAIVLFLYMLFLDIPPSILRAFVMLVVGFILYDRHFDLFSFEALFVGILIILSFFPRLVFSIGFWLSVGGVYYIYLFFVLFKNIKKIWQIVLVPVWVYLMMLPHSIYLFKNFSYLHPCSIVFTILFSVFYPLSMFLHLVGYGDMLDGVILWVLDLDPQPIHLHANGLFEGIFVFLSVCLFVFMFVKTRKNYLV